MQTHSHILENINKIKKNPVYLQAQNNYTCTQPWISAVYDAIAVRGFNAAPAAGIPHWQL